MQKANRHICILIVLAALCALASCEPSVTYSHYNHISSEGWNREDTIFFEADTLRHDGAYRFCLALRTTRRFPYQKVALQVERKVYRQKQEIYSKQEKVICPIATANGDYAGTGIGLLQYECPLRALQLQSGDSITFRISHYMNTEILPELRDVGILIEYNGSL